MYEREEEKLRKLKERLDQHPLPLETADERILAGIAQAKAGNIQRKRKRKRITWTAAMVAVLVLTFVTSIRISPAFANTIASIPGMEAFVAIIQQDKGLQAIFEEEYYQKIGVSETKENVTLTIDGVILDETGMNVYYTVESPKKMKNVQLKEMELTNSESIPSGGISYGGLGVEDVKSYQESLEITFEKRFVFDDLHFEFTTDIEVDGKETSFAIPFEVPKQTQLSKSYTLNETVELDGQQFTVDEVVISPLRTAVQVTFDESNSKKILAFEDMRLIDEKGEVWSKIANGVGAFGPEEGRRTHTFFLQSNYFTTPKRLYLQINKAQAVKQEQAYLVVNTDTKELIMYPDGPKLELVEATRLGLKLLSEVKEVRSDFFTTAIDSTGKTIHLSSSGISGEENGTSLSVTFETTSYTNPIRLELFAYPTYIEGDVNIEIK